MNNEEFETMQNFIREGGSLQMLADIDKKDMDTLYQYAVQLVECKDTEAARNIFYLLWRMDTWNYDYCFSLGLTCQQLKEHFEAIYCFARAGTIQVDNPFPSYHAGLSYKAVANEEYAKRSFKASLRWSNKRPEYIDVAVNAQQELDALA
ncbi:MAG: SycD/LcrH family type III secretion system chaperone [Parashewanella sp.]